MSITLLAFCLLLKLTTSDKTIDDGEPINFIITIDSSFPGNDVDALLAKLYWKTNVTQPSATINQYNCSFTPDGTTSDKDYTCDSSDWVTPINIGLPSISTSLPLVPYGIKLEYDHANAIAIEKIVVTLDNGYVYTVDTFCIHSNMACSFGLGTPNGECGYWSSKDEYNTMKVGGNTNFQHLYVDFRSDITSTPNLEYITHEGSVRPPTLKEFKITTVTPNSDIHYVSAQWDNVMYKCSSNPAMAATVATCTPDQFLLCPSLKSAFWVSFENSAFGAGETMTFTSAIITDETNNVFTMSQLCHENDVDVGGFWSTAAYGNNCTLLDQYYDMTAVGGVPIGGNSGPPAFIGYPNLEAFVAPNWAEDPLIETQDCIFNYPNNANNGLEIVIVHVDASQEGWGDNKYGGSPTFECPPTPDPTQYPTWQPTVDPTLAPLAPSNAPTQPPSLAPSLAPSIAPSISPSIAPTQPPSLAPSSAPTQPPSIAPTQPPSLAPSIAPSIHNAPTQPPSVAPSFAPSLTMLSTSFSSSQAFETTDEDNPLSTHGVGKNNNWLLWLITVLLLFFGCGIIIGVILYKRNKELNNVKMEINQASPSVHKNDDNDIIEMVNQTDIGNPGNLNIEDDTLNDVDIIASIHTKKDYQMDKGDRDIIKIVNKTNIGNSKNLHGDEDIISYVNKTDMGNKKNLYNDEDIVAVVNKTNIGNSDELNHNEEMIAIINNTDMDAQNGEQDEIMEGIGYDLNEDGAKQVSIWLQSIEFNRYYDNFVQNGFDSMKFINQINNENDLSDIGIVLKAHRLTLMNHINALKK